MLLIMRLPPLIAVMTLLVPVALQAQALTNRSDQTGVTLSSSTVTGGTFTSTSGPSISPVIANQATILAMQLTTGSMTSPSGAPFGQVAQGMVATVLTGGSTSGAATVQLAAMLSTASGGPAAALVTSVQGLLAGPTPASISSAVTAYNAFVNDAAAPFLANPPEEFLALHAVLARLTGAGGADGR